MRYLRAITLALMLAAWAAGPVAACCLPGSQPAEHQGASCREMGPQCGERMQASHSCTNPVNLDQSSLAARGQDTRPALAADYLAADAGAPNPLGTAISIGWLTSPSPPGPAPGAITILRI